MNGLLLQCWHQAVLAARGRSHRFLALTLCSKAELAMAVQSVVHLLVRTDTHLCAAVKTCPSCWSHDNNILAGRLSLRCWGGV
jgi:hypothetical protein